jgi:hypothetical protein
LDRSISFKNENKDSIEEIKIKKSKINDLIGREIILDDHGFYESYKVIFTKFIVEMGDNLIINTPIYRWEGFKDLINSAFEWERLLRMVMEIIKKEDKISENKAKAKLADIIVNLNIHAQDVNYIKNYWLAEPSTINTSFGLIQIFEIEHPRGFEDLIKVYEKIDEMFPDIIIEEYDARKSYTAAITFQRVRRSFLKDVDISSEYRHLHKKLQESIKRIISRSVKFKISSISIVKLEKEVHPLETIENFNFYLQ